MGGIPVKGCMSSFSHTHLFVLLVSCTNLRNYRNYLPVSSACRGGDGGSALTFIKGLMFAAHRMRTWGGVGVV